MTNAAKLLTALTGATLLACASPSYADPPATPGGAGDFRYQKTLTAPMRLEVKDLNGSITVEPASGDALEVIAVKSGPDATRVQILAREEGGAILLCALWPGHDAASCKAGASLQGDRGHVDATVDFKIRLPARVSALNASTVNGRVRAAGVRGDAEVSTMNGAIDVEATGKVSAHTMNGAMHVRAAAGREVHLETTNGAIEVSLPAAAAADVEASTTNGRISSDFVEVPPPAIPALHSARFKIGAGGTVVSLHTTNGDVHVRKL